MSIITHVKRSKSGQSNLLDVDTIIVFYYNLNMKRISLSLILFAAALAGATGIASDPAVGSESISEFPKPIVSEDYMLMPGDSLLVTVTGATNYSYITGVTYEGKVTLNMPVTSLPTIQGLYVPQYDVVAAVAVYGLSLKTAKDSLARVFSKYLRNIKIDLTLLGMRTFDVLVAGEVANPGIVRALPIHRVSSVIENAGGINAVGSRANIELKRREEPIKRVNLAQFDRTGEVGANPYVQDGDVIVVPQMDNSVVVKGAVFGKREYELRVAELTAAREKSSEGLYELLPGERVSDMIINAGGLTPWANATGAYIERNGDKLYINASHILDNPDDAQNIPMKNGDVLVIPSVNSVVYVQGQVVSPGSFPFQPNLRASDYIGIAGGPLSDASVSSAHVKRAGKKLSINDNPLIEEGDIIYVPRQIFKFWQDYLEIAAVIASLLISYLTLNQ